jgi:hypothetical protein
MKKSISKQVQKRFPEHARHLKFIAGLAEMFRADQAKLRKAVRAMR